MSTTTMRVPLGALFAGVLLTGTLTARPATAQTTAAMTGDYLFRTYCAACHGTSAKGDGPLADSMRRRPSDLTEIARRNKGVFPADEVFRIIDGRQPVRGHGGPDMPVWGDVFARSEGGGNPAVVEARIKALVAYLEGVQTKAAN
jgi:cytochrome c1